MLQDFPVMFQLRSVVCQNNYAVEKLYSDCSIRVFDTTVNVLLGYSKMW